MRWQLCGKRLLILLNNKKYGGFTMDLFWTVAVILVVLWLFGLIGGFGGWLIHLLLVIAVIVVLIRLIQGKDLATGK